MGGCAGVLPLDAVGRQNKKVPTVYAHSDFLTDMCWSPFDDDLLATCSNDGSLKLWRIPEEFTETLDQPLAVVDLQMQTVSRGKFSFLFVLFLLGTRDEILNV